MLGTDFTLVRLQACTVVQMMSSLFSNKTLHFLVLSFVFRQYISPNFENKQSKRTSI
jgi:hypothetical protein